MTTEGQIEGGMIMGLGAALSEELKISEGKVLNPSFLDYKVPRSLDCPDQETLLIETIDSGGPYGAKGISEGAAIPIAPAIANAIYDAIGIRLNSIPITPEKVLQATSTLSNTD
jgi:xanthine dehydrogenase molybdenum-binding subunit